MKYEYTKMHSEFLTKLAEERKDKDTKMQSIFLTKPVEERRGRISTPLEQRKF